MLRQESVVINEWGDGFRTQLLYEVNQRRNQAAKMGDYAKRCVVEMVRRVSRILLQAQREVGRKTST
jgi:hypothetical protein